MYALTQILGGEGEAHLVMVGWMSMGRKSGISREGEENVVYNLSKLILDYSLIRRTLSLVSGLEFPWCSFNYCPRTGIEHIFL